jgi:hypothetical protein
MESHGVPCMTHLSHATHAALRRPGAVPARFRGTIDVKGLGPMDTYLVPGAGADAAAATAATAAAADARVESAAAAAAAAALAGAMAAAELTAAEAAESAALRGGRTRVPRGSCEVHMSEEEAAAEAAALEAAEAAVAGGSSGADAQRDRAPAGAAGGT